MRNNYKIDYPKIVTLLLSLIFIAVFYLVISKFSEKKPTSTDKEDTQIKTNNILLQQVGRELATLKKTIEQRKPVNTTITNIYKSYEKTIDSVKHLNNHDAAIYLTKWIDSLRYMQSVNKR